VGPRGRKLWIVSRSLDCVCDQRERTSIGVVMDAFARHGQRVALRHEQGDWTFVQLSAAVYRMARALQSEGLGRGETIAILAGNQPETFVLRYAAQVIGCGVAVLYQQLATPMLAEMLRASEAAALVFDSTRFADAGRALLGELPGIAGFALGDCRGATDIVARAASRSSESMAIDARPEDVADIRFTSGTTGTPKGIPRTFRVPAYFAPSTLAVWADATQLLCTPVGHLGGTLAVVVLVAGGCVVLHERFEAGDVLAAIERERVSFAWMQPILLHQLLDHPAVETTDTSSLRSINVGGWASTPHRIVEAMERFGPIVVQGYGASEAGQITWLSQEEHVNPDLLTTVGRPVPGVDVSIRDSDGQPVASGITGEIWVRGPSMMTGYYKQPEQTARVLRDGWFRSGDLGFLDVEGYLTIVGRIKDVIITTDVHIHPSQVEGVLMKHPGIQAAVVFGFTSGEDNDERVGAAVVPTPTHQLSRNEIASRVSVELGAPYVPEVILIVDTLPTTGSQKPDRDALRKIATATTAST